MLHSEHKTGERSNASQLTAMISVTIQSNELLSHCLFSLFDSVLVYSIELSSSRGNYIEDKSELNYTMPSLHYYTLAKLKER